MFFCFCFYFAGLACQSAGRRESAEVYFRLSVDLDPLMWASIQSLCELGAELDVDTQFDAFLKKAAVATAAGAPEKGGPKAGRSAGVDVSRAAVGSRGGGGAGMLEGMPWASYLQSGRAPLGYGGPLGAEGSDRGTGGFNGTLVGCLEEGCCSFFIVVWCV